MRIPWWGKLGALALVTLAALAAATSWAGSQPGGSAYNTIVIYFYPNDYQPEQQYIDQIDPTVANVQQWYGAQVGKTFVTSPVVVVRGQHNSAWYSTAVWTNVLTELRDRGYADYCGQRTVMIFVASSIPFTGGGSCDPAYTAEWGGVAMWPDSIFDQMLGKPPPSGSEWCWTPDCSRGVIAHELGHAFTLPHPEGCGVTWPDYCALTVMWSWWNYPNAGLLDLKVAPEKQTLANSPFFSVSSATSSATATPAPSPTPTPSEPASASSTSSATATPKPSPTPTPTPSAPDTVAPAVTIVKPGDRSVIRSRWLQVKAAANDNVGVTEVQLYVDSQMVFTTTAANLEYAWDTLRVAKGTSIKVTVRAQDGAGNVSAAEVTVSK